MAEQHEDEALADGQEQAEEEQQEQQKNPKLQKPRRFLVSDNIKRSDIAPWDRNDKKLLGQPGKCRPAES